MNKIFKPENRHGLDNPERKMLVNPEEILQQLNYSAEDNFMDIGAGTGYFFIPALNKNHPDSKKIALDISDIMLNEIKTKLPEIPKNVEFIVADARNIPVQDKSLDKILLAFVFHEFDNPSEYMHEFNRVLKPGGSIGILEWSEKNLGFGAPMHERISQENLMQLFSDNAYLLKDNPEISEAFYFHIYENSMD